MSKIRDISQGKKDQAIGLSDSAYINSWWHSVHLDYMAQLIGEVYPQQSCHQSDKRVKAGSLNTSCVSITKFPERE